MTTHNTTLQKNTILQTDLEDKNVESSWVVRIGGLVMSVVIMLSSWFLKEAWEKINTIENKVQALEVSNAATSSNRFTSTDWNNNKSLIDADRLALDRRVMRLEENSTSIKESLQRIENSLNDHLKEIKDGKGK